MRTVEFASMRTFEELDLLWAAAPAPPRDRGSVRLICLRVEPGAHKTPDQAELDVDHGLVGDRWDRARERDPGRESQVTVMNATAAELVAAGVQPLH
jgi:hypothetical protein